MAMAAYWLTLSANPLLRAIERASRALKQVRKNRKRDLRRELVHIAGCTYRGVHKCASIDCLDETLGDALALGVAIPRSLRARARRVWAQKLAASRGMYDALFEVEV